MSALPLKADIGGSNSRRFGATSTIKLLTPVTLPPTFAPDIEDMQLEPAVASRDASTS
jgi:hypothetical protein